MAFNGGWREDEMSPQTKADIFFLYRSGKLGPIADALGIYRSTATEKSPPFEKSFPLEDLMLHKGVSAMTRQGIAMLNDMRKEDGD